MSVAKQYGQDWSVGLCKKLHVLCKEALPQEQPGERERVLRIIPNMINMHVMLFLFLICASFFVQTWLVFRHVIIMLLKRLWWHFWSGLDDFGPGLFSSAGSPAAHHLFRPRFLHPGPAGLLRCSDLEALGDSLRCERIDFFQRVQV